MPRKINTSTVGEERTVSNIWVALCGRPEIQNAIFINQWPGEIQLVQGLLSTQEALGGLWCISVVGAL